MIGSPGYAAVVASPLPDGQRLGLVCSASALLAIDFLPADTPVTAPRGGAAQAAAAVLGAYFAGAPLPGCLLEPAGSPYQRRVWQALQAIPPGTTCRYGELARRLGSGARAVAGACRANPIPLLIPCHRVVAADGAGGYMGQRSGPALALKQWLLAHEHAL